LIKCSECGLVLSSKASGCLHCGNPIAISPEARAAKTRITTGQATAKKFASSTHQAVARTFVRVSFGEIEAQVPAKPGIYEIHTLARVMSPRKVSPLAP
jgi:hypothetical protein